MLERETDKIHQLKNLNQNEFFKSIIGYFISTLSSFR